MSLKVTILGTGSVRRGSAHRRRLGRLRSTNPKNRRRRCSLLVQRDGDEGTTNVLVDTPPDCRDQLLDAGVGLLDGVLYTHDHADHTHGIDDLRVVAYNGHRRVETYADRATLQMLLQRFDYCFETPSGSEYPAVLLGRKISPGETAHIVGPGGAIDAVAFGQIHGRGETLGFRFGGLAYSPDVSDLPEEVADSPARTRRAGFSTRSATRRIPAISRSSGALTWIEKLKPKRARAHPYACRSRLRDPCRGAAAGRRAGL